MSVLKLQAFHNDVGSNVVAVMVAADDALASDIQAAQAEGARMLQCTPASAVLLGSSAVADAVRRPCDRPQRVSCDCKEFAQRIQQQCLLAVSGTAASMCTCVALFHVQIAQAYAHNR